LKLFLALLFCAPLIAFADAAEGLKNRLDAIQSLRGHFTQTLTDKSGANLQSSSGEFALQRPGYFLWQSAAPYEQTVIGTPEKVWIYDPDLEQVTIRGAEQQADKSPARLLSGDLSELRSSYDVSTTADDKNAYRLAPRSSDSPYRYIEFSFSGDKLTALHFQDKLDQKTQIRFEQLQVNPSIPADTFVFTAPEGTDVIIDE
jgi:outer membrane lipoprotein carrier protein